MKITVEGADSIARVGLEDPDSFTEFSVVAPQSFDEARLQSALGDLGRVDGEGHVFVRLESLKRLAGERGADQDWLASLAGMVAFASSRGWVDDDGDVRAHIERSAS